MSSMGSTAAELAGAYAKAMADRDIAAIGELYRPDALVDVNVPTWRYQLQGPESVSAALGENLPKGPFTTTARPLDPSEWAGIELEYRLGEGDDAPLIREVNLVRVVDGRIAEHVIYCTGEWDAATIARQADQAPMVRW
jgi:hypothetical protein